MKRTIYIRPSGAPVWAHPQGCPGYATWEPDQDDAETSTPYTERGHRIHDAIASILRPDLHKRPPHMQAGEWDFASHCVRLLEQEVEVENFDWRVEERAELIIGAEGAKLFGRPDLVGIPRVGWRGKKSEIAAVVVDWKTGENVQVEAEGNQQLLCYAAMSLLKREGMEDDQQVLLYVVQPSAEKRGRSPVKKWVITVGELRAEWRRIRDIAIDLADAEKPVGYNPSERNCKWCLGKRRGVCHALEEAGLEITEGIETIRVSPEGYAEFLRKFEAAQQFAEVVREQAAKRLEEGHAVPGLKLVAGRRGARKWTDEGDAYAYIHDTCSGVEPWDEPRLKTPAVLLKEMRASDNREEAKEVEERFVVQAPAKPTVAFEHDPRDAIDASSVARLAAENFQEKPKRKGSKK